jgi:hypothetical protein
MFHVKHIVNAECKFRIADLFKNPSLPPEAVKLFRRRLGKDIFKVLQLRII